MEYLITQSNPASQYIEITLKLSCQKGETVRLQLPSWRAGRYELANYAQNIRQFSVYSPQKKVFLAKETKDLWIFHAHESGPYTISYEYYASRMDAGSSWSDPDQLYLNFINFALQVNGREMEPIGIALSLPKNYLVGTSLSSAGGEPGLRFTASDFQHLVDSPLIASPSLQHFSYTLQDIAFHVWIQGEIHFDIDRLLEVFRGFTHRQCMAFSDFPATDYHFLFQLLPYPHYHGVEHQYSTVITYGPADSLALLPKMDELVGVSSHELYHFWNVCRIRPKALLPYDFSKEAYFQEGVVAEGVTTYFGDIYLLRSGYFSLERYLSKLAVLLKREFDSQGWQSQSVAASSFDLWLDGYRAGIPDKKVSIYNRGALISLCLDLMLMDDGSSLEVVMQKMWTRFGNLRRGYTLDDFEKAARSACERPEAVTAFFEKYVHGTEHILPEIKTQLLSVGVVLDLLPSEDILEERYGIMRDDDMRIFRIHRDAPAYQKLMLGDKVLEIENKEDSLSLGFERNGILKHTHLERSGRSFYYQYALSVNPEDNLKRERWMR